MSESKNSSSSSNTASSLQALVQPSSAGSDLTNAHPKDDDTECAQRVITSSADLPRRPIDKDSKAFDFKTDKQQFCLINMAHKEQKCKSDTAAIRILGCFKTKEKALKHSKSMQSELDIFIQPTHSWFPVTTRPVTPETAQQVQTETIRKVEEYISASATKKEEIVEQATEEQAAERHERANELWQEGEALQQALDESCGSADAGVCDTVEAVSRQFEVRGQAYAVISIVGQPDIDDEPVINVLRAFESKDDARDYLRNTVHMEEVVTNCYVVAMYEWIAPVLVFTKKFFDEVESNYTHTQLEEIHHGKRAERKKIEKLLASRGKSMADVDAFMADLEAEQQETPEEGEGGAEKEQEPAVAQEDSAAKPTAVEAGM